MPDDDFAHLFCYWNVSKLRSIPIFSGKNFILQKNSVIFELYKNILKY